MVQKKKAVKKVVRKVVKKAVKKGDAYNAACVDLL